MMQIIRSTVFFKKLCKPQISFKYLSTCDQIYTKYSVGKSAVVTGCSKGIGLECVKTLLKNGVMNIVMSSSSNVKLAEEELNQLRRKYIRSSLCFVKCDVTDFEDMNALFKTATSMFGTIDIVINNAGIFKESNWCRMIDINLKGVIYGTKLGMNCMSKQSGGKGGTIVNVSSILGLAPFGGAPVYTATKHGVIGLTRSMATSFHYDKSGVRVMAMCPGVTDTALIRNATSETRTPLAQEASRELTMLPAQHVCYCGQCLMEMLKEGDTGSIWIVEDKEIYEIEIPERISLKKIK